MSLVKDFNDYRARMNEVILSKNNLVMKRLWNLDTNTYDAGALDKKTKEMLDGFFDTITLEMMAGNFDKTATPTGAKGPASAA